MTLRMSVVAASAFCLIACGKVTETATEKVIESKLSKDGTQAKVDLSGGGLKMTSTDASGKTTQIDMGTATRKALEIAAAFMLAHPELRGWGIALAALIMFGAVITLLSHEQYLWAAPSMVLMAALIPAGLAVPRVSHSVHYAPTQTVSVPAVSGQQVAENGHAL